MPADPAAWEKEPDPRCLLEPLQCLDISATGIGAVIWATGYAAKLEREIEVTSVAQLGSFFVTKFQDQVTSATVDSLESSKARNALSEFEFTF